MKAFWHRMSAASTSPSLSLPMVAAQRCRQRPAQQAWACKLLLTSRALRTYSGAGLNNSRYRRYTVGEDGATPLVVFTSNTQSATCFSAKLRHSISIRW